VSLPYIVLAGLLGMTAADFLSGLVHWAGKRISGYIKHVYFYDFN
jgi:hypothetical protein